MDLIGFRSVFMSAQFYLTNVGKAAAIDAENLGLKLQLDYIAVGNGKYDGQSQGASKTALVNELARYSLSGGGSNEDTLNLIASIDSTITSAIYEIGLITKSGILFAVAATAANTPILNLVNEITTILTIGVQLVDIDNVSTITVKMSTEGLIATKLMNEHLAASNPHPQYAPKSIVKTVTENSQKISAVEENLQTQISNLSAGLATLYPKVIMAGVIQQGENRVINRPDGSSISFLDARYAIQITPEAGHEAWEMARTDSKISLNVWNRSGTNRIGYGGRISWSITQTEGLTSTSGNGNYYYTGSEIVFPILSGESKSFLLFGGGGGGGSSRYYDLATDSSPAKLLASNGEDSYLKIDGTDIVFTAGGGSGGSGGVDAGDGQYIDGQGGNGGKWSLVGEYESATRTNGQSGNATAEDHSGAESDSSSRGAGGDGANGYATATQGFGGGGGEGATLSIVYTNKSSDVQYARLYVGKAGAGEQSLASAENYVQGVNGQDGFIRVASAA